MNISIFHCLTCHFRLIATYLSKQKELDVDPKVIPKIEFVRRLKNSNDAAFANESMFVLTILEEKKTIVFFSQGSVTVL